MTCGEVRPLVNNAVLIRVRVMRAEFQPFRANRVIGDAQLIGFARIQWSDHDGRLAEKVHRPNIRYSEKDHRGDVLSHLGPQRLRHGGGSTPSGTTFEVTKPITAAPWEYPPSTILVFGHCAAMETTCAPASLMPSTPVGQSSVAG